MNGTKAEPYHFTSLESYLYCPRKFMYERDVGPLYISWYALRGTIIHNTFEQGMKHFRKIFWEYVNNQSLPIKLPPNMEVTPEQFEKECLSLEKLLPNYWRYLDMFGIEVLEREKTFNTSLTSPDSFDKRAGCVIREPKVYWFQGTVDAITLHPDTPEGMVEIDDYKSGRKWGSNVLDRKLQFGGYFLLTRPTLQVNRIFWGHVKHLDPLKSNSKSTGARKGEFSKPFLYPVKITDEDIPFIKEQTFTIIECIERGLFPWAAEGADAPCGICPYAAKVCPKFAVGNKNQDESVDELQLAMMKNKLRDHPK